MNSHNPSSAAQTQEPVPSEVWARRLQRGEPTAVNKVRQRVRKILSHGRLAIPGQERDDLEQQVVTEIWQAVHRPGFDFTGGFWSFLEVVTSRRCIDWLRTRKDEDVLVDQYRSRTRGPLQQTLQRERAVVALEVLSALKPACRHLITLRFQQGMTYAEIATHLGKSEGALRVQFHRCIESARKILKRKIRSQRRE